MSTQKRPGPSYGDFCDKDRIFQSMADKWPSSIVWRGMIADFTGGIIQPPAIANLDSQGKGPPKIKIGRKIAYPVPGLIEWLKNL